MLDSSSKSDHPSTSAAGLSARSPGLAAARAPRSPRASRLLVVDPKRGRFAFGAASDLLDHLERGDRLILNDAGTLPASLRGRTSAGAELEVRLASDEGGGRWRVVLFGGGDWRTPTEHRPLPPALRPGDTIDFSSRFRARVLAVEAFSSVLVEGRSEGGAPAVARLAKLAFEANGGDVIAEIFRLGRPVQYSYLERDLALDEVQVGYSARPWSMEMPSAGRPLTSELLLLALRRGIGVATLTHAAGLSSMGDDVLDRLLPFPERYEIPERTSRAIEVTRAAGGRIIAVGTTVVRALEDAARRSFDAGVHVTDLKIQDGFERRVVDGILSGVHEPGSSHFELLEAFAPRRLLAEAHEAAARAGYLGHEFGDSCLVLDALR